MYILGFILIFAGLALMLYYFVLRFAGATSVSPPSVVQAVTEPAPTGRVTAEPVVREFSPSVPHNAVRDIPQPPKEPTQRRPADDAGRETMRVIDRPPEKELYATGYLYTDASGKMALLEHPERVEGELTASMKRLGPATLRFRGDAYYFDHGDGLLVIPERKMREVRFSDGGTVFVPGSSDLPLVYFFTVDTQTIREFLSSRS